MKRKNSFLGEVYMLFIDYLNLCTSTYIYVIKFKINDIFEIVLGTYPHHRKYFV